MSDSKPEKEEVTEPVDSSTARTMELDALMAAMLQEIENRQLYLNWTRDWRRRAGRRWWKQYSVCSCRREDLEEEERKEK